MSSGGSLKRKVGAALSPVRWAGSLDTLASMNQFFLIGGIMVLVGSSHWNMSLGQIPGDFGKDEEGLATMKNLGLNMAWLLGKIAHKG